ncbi:MULTISPECIES: morphogenic membrane protein MmpA [unclassified Streptomyces]
MTTPVPTPLRPVERGLTAVLAVAGLVSLAWVCAMLYVVFAWVVAAA